MHLRLAPVIAVALAIFAVPSSGQVTPLLELKVYNGSSQARTNEPVSFGIPVAQGNQLFALDWFQIVDSSLTPVARQFKVLTRWGGDRSDTSKPIRWALVTFNATVAANSAAIYHVALGGAAAYGQLWASDQAQFIEVHTTPTTYFRVNKTQFKLFDTAVVSGTSLVNPGRLDMVNSSGAMVTPVVTETVLEEYGEYLSVRCVVRQRGQLGQLRFTCRWYFYSGRSDVTVDFRLENPNAYGLFSSTLADGQVYFDSLYLVQPVIGTTSYTLTTDTAVHALTPSQFYDLKQDYSAAAQTDALDLWTGFGCSEILGASTVGTGNRFKGAVDLKGSSGGVTVAYDRFWQNFPKSFRSQSGELKIGLFPEWGHGPEYRGQYATPTSTSPPIDPMALTNYRFEGGRWKTHKMVFDFHTGGTTTSAVSADADKVDAPLIGTSSPIWIRLTEATGSLWVERHGTTDVGELRWEKFTDMLADDAAADSTNVGQIGYPAFIRRGGTYGGKQSYGWDNFGDIVWSEGFCSQHYDWTQCFMLGFWRTGDYRLFNYGRDVAASRRDYNQNHSTNPLEGWRGCQFYEKGWWHGNYAGGATSHNWVEGLLMYHVMTGDEAAREAAVECVAFVLRAAPPKNWSGWYGSRIPGWGIDNLMAGYSYLGDPLYLTEAGLGVYRYEQLEVAGGVPGCVINPANGETQSWMENIFHIAACKYQLASGDTGCLGLLGRMRDWFKNDVCILPTGTFPNLTLTMVHEHWTPAGGLNMHVNHCWAMSESFAYSAVVFDSTDDLLWSQAFFHGPARYWQKSPNPFTQYDCLNASTFSAVCFRPTQFPGTESKVLSNALRFGTAYQAAKVKVTGLY